MLLSMTGYGRALGSFGDKTILVEVRTLNSKVTDIKLKLPGDYREKEIELRKIITDHAERGKIDLIIDVQNADGGANVSLNESLIRGYYRELSRISTELSLPQQDILTAILRIPNVIASPISEMDEQEWVAVCGVLNQTLNHLRNFRKEEGAVMEADLQLRINNILSLLGDVTPFENERIIRVRERLRGNIEEVIGRDNYDSNRFEQELVFYLEKMDMSEEKLRLEQHCKYFLEQMKNNKNSVGRTLNFISQEICR